MCVLLSLLSFYYHYYHHYYYSITDKDDTVTKHFTCYTVMLLKIIIYIYIIDGTINRNQESEVLDVFLEL